MFVLFLSAVRRINERRHGLWTLMTPTPPVEFEIQCGPRSILLLTSALMHHQEQSTHSLAGRSLLDFPEGAKLLISVF